MHRTPEMNENIMPRSHAHPRRMSSECGWLCDVCVQRTTPHTHSLTSHACTQHTLTPLSMGMRPEVSTDERGKYYAGMQPSGHSAPTDPKSS